MKIQSRKIPTHSLKKFPRISQASGSARANFGRSAQQTGGALLFLLGGILMAVVLFGARGLLVDWQQFQDVQRLRRQGERVVGHIRSYKPLASDLATTEKAGKRLGYAFQRVYVAIEYPQDNGTSREIEENWLTMPGAIPYKEGEPITVLYLPENRRVQAASVHHPRINLPDPLRASDAASEDQSNDL